MLLRTGIALLMIGSAHADPALAILNPELRHLESTLSEKSRELASLGSPIVGQTVTQFGYQHVQLRVPPPESPWLQVDLGKSIAIDQIALVPALVDFQPVERRAYGFPRRFRVDISDDEDFTNFTPVLVHTDEDFPDPKAAPVVLENHSRAARYIRVTVTRLAEENGVFFYALAELMATHGNRNIAIGKKVSFSNSSTLPPRWSAVNLVDGRTPLGPPIRQDLLPYDGLFPQASAEHPLAWVAVDLGKSTTIDEIRLHPVHARLGADVPGFSFPLRFRIEGSDGGDPWTTLHETSGDDFPNPGNNPVTLPLTDRPQARHIRVLCIKEGSGRKPRSGSRNRSLLRRCEHRPRRPCHLLRRHHRHRKPPSRLPHH